MKENTKYIRDLNIVKKMTENRGKKPDLIIHEEASFFDKYIIGCDVGFKKDIACMIVMKNGKVISTIKTYDKDFHKQLEEYLNKWDKTVMINQE